MLLTRDDSLPIEEEPDIAEVDPEPAHDRDPVEGTFAGRGDVYCPGVSQEQTDRVNELEDVWRRHGVDV
ncbi:hypothetical protein ACFL2Q_15755 [Thermodesulfobacteriota bacterium]